MASKLCRFCENEKGFKMGFVCAMTGKHIDTSDDWYDRYCDSSDCERCPFYPEEFKR